MDSTDTPTPLQPTRNQGEVGVLNLLMRNPPLYASTSTIHGPASHGAAYSNPNAPPPPSVPHNSGILASSEPGREEPGIGAYLHIPCVKRVYDAFWNVSGSLSTLSTIMFRLSDENRELREYVERVKRDQRPWMVEEPMNYATYQHTESGSLAPSDSISQRLSPQPSGSHEPREIQPETPPALRTPRHQPGMRPDDLPFEVLWYREDCQQDTKGARPAASNGSRPRMTNAIRERDGTPIDRDTYKAIQRSVAKQVGILIQQEEARLKKSLTKDEMMKKYFELRRIKQWLHAIAVIEEEHPVLTYAASHWKAEQLLMNQLTSMRSQHQKKVSGHISRKTKE